MAEFIIEDEPTLVIEDEPVKRVSSPGKQALAGFSDIATGIPAILGLAGAGIETLVKTPFTDTTIGEDFAAALSTGFDRSLVNVGLSGRKAVNESLGIEEPVSTEDQAARLSASLLPIPGIRVASGAGRLAKILGGTANVLTPAVKLGPKGARFGKGFKVRAGAQLGIGTGIDQGIRALVDTPELPLMFSDVALSGGTDTGDLVIEDVPELVIEDVEDVTFDTLVFEDTDDGFEARRELDQKVQKQEDWENIKTWMIVAGAAAGSYAGVKFAQSLAIKKANSVAPFGVPDPKLNKAEQLVVDLDQAHLKDYPGLLNQGRKDAGSYIGEAFVDRGKALYHGLRAQGHSKETADQVMENSHIDTSGMAQNVIETGEFGQGFNKVTHAVRDLEIEHAALGDSKKLFDEGMLAQTEIATRSIDEAAPSLWRQSRSDVDLKKMLDDARANPDVSKLMDKFSEVFDTHLEYQKFRGLITETEVTNFRTKFTNPDTGQLTYMPLYSASRKKFMQRLARKFGIHTDKAKQLDLMGEFHTRGLDGIEKPLGPMEALRQYTIHSIDNANTSAFHYQALANLSGIQIHGGDVSRFALDRNGKIIPTLVPRKDQTGRGTSFIGKGEIDDATDAVQVKLDKNYSGTIREGSVNDMRAQVPEEIMTVQHGGELLAFHVPDPAIRAALNLNPQLGTALQFMNHWKSVFTRFTTGNLSAFAPISHAFSSQQVALATAGREGVKSSLKTVGESLSGSKEIFLVNSAKEIAQYLSFRLATNTGIGKMAPEASTLIKNALEKRFRNSLLNQVRGETGRISSGLQADTFTGSVADFADSVGRNFGQKFGQDQMGLVWRLWKGWNTALHEGPAFGAMQKHIGRARIEGQEITPKLIREAVDFSKTVAGDMRRLGASDAAKAFNASVPFSAAMIQSWNALGSAAMHNWKAFSAGIATLIGVPTVSEMVYNTMLSAEGTTFMDERGKEWTYNDYYWNGYTTQQRADNMIIFIPGKPPWEAITMPVSPEFGLFRGAIMEGMDVIFNFSQTGAIGDADAKSGKVGRDQFMASLARVLDIPVPPLVAAAFSKAGIDLRFGVAIDQTDNPDDPGETLSFLRTIPLGQGERVTRRAGKAKFAESSLDTDTVAILQDLFGSGGALYVAVHEAFVSGKKLAGGSIVAGIENAADALGTGLRRQARWTQPLFGKTLRPNANDEIARNLFNRRQNLKRLSNDFNSYFSGGKLSPSGRPTVGNTDVPPDDPINLELAGDAKQVDAMIGVLDKDISDLRRQISTMGNATNLGSITERNDLIDARTLEIQSLKARQLSAIIDYEKRASEVLSERYGRDIDINLATFAPRANLPASSISQELRKSPQTSQ